MIGTFCALDFFLFYVFWEIMLVPMYFIIGIWGGARKLYAAIKFFLYTLSGSVLMLLGDPGALLLQRRRHPVPQHHGPRQPATFSVLQYHNIGHLIPPTLQFWIFLGFFLGFAIKVPMFPFHTWLPDAHVEAPTAGSIILAAVLLKMGTYGFVRFALPILPDATKQLLRADRRPGDHRHHLRRARVAGAEGHEEARRLLVGLAPRLRHAGHVRAEPDGHRAARSSR